MSFILNNSIWPNEEGNLGENKVAIPDGATIKWPDGDALVGNFVYKDGKLVGFVDTKALTVNGSGSTTIDYDYTNIELPFAEDAMTINRGPRSKYLFIRFNNKEVESFDFVIIDFNTTDQETIDTVRTANRVVNNKLYDDAGLIGTIDTSKIEVGGIYSIAARKMDGLFCNINMDRSERGLVLSEFNSDLSSLVDGNIMFCECSNLISFTSDLSSLTEGDYMFFNCSQLTSFDSDLPNLMDGNNMFCGCSNLTSFNNDLPSLTNGINMFFNCPQLISFNSDLPNLIDGETMFYNCTNLTSFNNNNLSSLTNGEQMFHGCSQLTSFTSDLSSLTKGNHMFNGCSQLISFDSDLRSLVEGDWMFYNCSHLTSFNSDLSSLTNVIAMFNGCSQLTSFTTDLPNLTTGKSMFTLCSQLTSFDSDLSSLTEGDYMFNGCSQLTSFDSDLSSLTKGDWMFGGCKLDAPSVKNIIDTINTYSGELTLGMGCDNTVEDKDLFAQEVGYADMTSLLAALQAKGWSVNGQYTGRPTTTYSLRKTSIDTLPVFVKLEEVEDHADYTSEDGSKKYRLKWFHETTGSTEGYTQYTTLEEAIETLNIKPIEN